jgi:hypothetical protein
MNQLAKMERDFSNRVSLASPLAQGQRTQVRGSFKGLVAEAGEPHPSPLPYEGRGDPCALT